MTPLEVLRWYAQAQRELVERGWSDAEYAELKQRYKRLFEEAKRR